MANRPALDPALVAEQMNQPWREQAACAGLWRLMADPAREDEAVEVCMSRCPVVAKCASWVLALPDWEDPGGVVGGWREARRAPHRQRIRLLAYNRRRRAELARAQQESAAHAARVQEEARRVEEEQRLRSLSTAELLDEVIAVLAAEFGYPRSARDFRDAEAA